MKAFVKDFDCADIDDLFSYVPTDPNNFGFWMNFSIGLQGEEGADNFQMLIATPNYIQQQHPFQNAVLPHNTLLVFEYDFNQILNTVDKYVKSLNEDSWEKLAEKLCRIAHWEFEDYKPYKS
jgi:hypothetical protein